MIGACKKSGAVTAAESADRAAICEIGHAHNHIIVTRDQNKHSGKDLPDP